jgi:hypothetical protein
VGYLKAWNIQTELTLPLLGADCCNKMIVTDTFYGNNQRDEE